MDIKEKIDGSLAFINIGDVSFVVFSKDWNWIKKKIENKEEFSFKTLSNKKIEVVKNKINGTLEIIDTYKKSRAFLFK